MSVALGAANPSPHALHAAEGLSFRSWYKPKMQEVQSEREFEKAFPAGQNEHSGEYASFCAWYVPLAHEGHAVLGDSKLVPAGQNLHLYSMDAARS